jgi:hypothetical protein
VAAVSGGCQCFLVTNTKEIAMKFKVYRHFAASIDGKDIFIVDADSEEDAKSKVIEDEEMEPEEHIVEYETNHEYLAYEAEEVGEDVSC